jgi:D-glycero-D-manno-heptose 1,7-bisphosphate phosphatase
MIFRVNVKQKEPEKVAFIDRDGTLIEDNGYLSDPAKMRPIGDSISSLNKLRDSGFALFLISNQAGLAKGKIKIEEFRQVKRKFEEMFDPKMTIFDGIFYCPHHVEGIVGGLKGICACRKPGTLMLDTALRFLRKVPPPQSVFTIGDKTIDIMVGKNKMFQTILVETGYGMGDKEKITEPLMFPDYIAADFDEAVSIMSERL